MAGKFLDGARRFAFDRIKSHEGQTCRELESRRSHEGHAIPEGTIRRRVAELVESGYVKKGERRTCEVTGRLAATLWTV